MHSNFYVGLSGQVAIERRLQTVANNIANMNTAGFRADGVQFSSVLAQTGSDSVAYVSDAGSYISRRAGELSKTDNPLDVAVQGDAWFAVKTPQGVIYTRDGRLKMGPNGDVTTLTNDPILDAGNAPLQLDPDAGPPAIAADGMLTQGGRQIGAIGLFSIDPKAVLTRAGNSGVKPSIPATPVLDFTENGVAQGYVEGANVNPVLELSRLIDIQHQLDSVTSMNQTSDTSLQDAIKTLGGSS